jgi:hypothetical protein
MLSGKKILDPTYKYHGMSREDIIALWDANGKEASEKGTAMHENIEKYYNNIHG